MIKSVPHAPLPVEGGSQLCSQQRKGGHADGFNSLPRPLFLLEWMLPRSAPACGADGVPACVCFCWGSGLTKDYFRTCYSVELEKYNLSEG